MKTYYAVQPGRYLAEMVPMRGSGASDTVVIDPGGAEHKFRNQIVGYKVVVNEDDMTYQTMFTKGGGVWQERRPLGPLSDATREEIEREAAAGHLYLGDLPKDISWVASAEL